MSKDTIKKIGNILFNVVLYVFLVICVIVVCLTVFSKKDVDGAAEILNYQMRIVTSESMAKCEHTDVSDFDIKDIPLRSMIFIQLVPQNEEEATEWYRSLKEGDVLTFRYVYASQVTITHRITRILEKETGGFVIELAGDNKDSDDGQLYQVIDTSVPYNTNYVIGKVTGTSYLFGVLMSFLTKKLSILLIVILPCFVIVLLEVIKVVRMLSADKRKQEMEKREAAEAELEELRQRLAALEKKNNENSGDSGEAKESE